MRRLAEQFERIVIPGDQILESFVQRLAAPVLVEQVRPVGGGQVWRQRKGLIIEQGGVDVGAEGFGGAPGSGEGEQEHGQAKELEEFHIIRLRFGGFAVCLPVNSGWKGKGSFSWRWGVVE